MGLADVDKLAAAVHKLVDAIGFTSEKAAELHAEIPEAAPVSEPVAEVPAPVAESEPVPAPEPPLAELPPEPVLTPDPDSLPPVEGPVDPSGGGAFGTESEPSG